MLRPIPVNAIVVDVVAGESLVELGSERVGIVQALPHRHGAAEEDHVGAGRIGPLLHRAASESVRAIRDVVADTPVGHVLDRVERAIARKHVPILGHLVDHRRHVALPQAKVGTRTAGIHPRQHLRDGHRERDRAERKLEVSEDCGEASARPAHRSKIGCRTATGSWTTITRDMLRRTAMLACLGVLLAGVGCAVSTSSKSVPVLLYHRISADRTKADNEWVPLEAFEV